MEIAELSFRRTLKSVTWPESKVGKTHPFWWMRLISKIYEISSLWDILKLNLNPFRHNLI